jgi:hypothetical protein
MRSRRRYPTMFALPATVIALAAFQVPPVSAAAAVMAAGELQVRVSITPGIAPITALQCAPDTFSFSGGGQVVSFLAGDVGDYVGPITLSGTGSSACSDALRDTFATVSVTVGPNSNFSGDVSCPLLTGSLVRVATHALLVLGGTCTLNGSPYTSAFVSTGEFAPDSGEGLTVPITGGTYTGAFSLAA